MFRFRLRLTALVAFFLLIKFFPYSKEIIFSFFIGFGCIDPGDPGRAFKGLLCIVSKGHSHSQGVPSTWKT